MMEIKTTNEILKHCIEYKQITNHWGNFKNKKWVALDDLREAVKNIPELKETGNVNIILKQLGIEKRS